MRQIYEGALKAIQDYIDYYTLNYDYEDHMQSKLLESMINKRTRILKRMYRTYLSSFRAN